MSRSLKEMVGSIAASLSSPTVPPVPAGPIPNGSAERSPSTVVEASTFETSRRIDGWNSTSSNACRVRPSETSAPAPPSV
jgi:hypothetical protein